MPKTPFALPPEAVRPLYAVAGATDLAVARARGYVAEAQKKAQKAQQTAADFEPQTLQTQLESAVADLREQARALPTEVSGRIETYLNGIVAELETAYADLASRGEKVVGRIRNQQATEDAEAAVKTATSRAKATTTTAKKAASSTTTRAKSGARGTRSTAAKGAKSTRSSAKATGTTAKKAASKTAKAVSDATEKVGD